MGRLPYRAPELLFGAENYNYSVDIWSMACVVCEMLFLEPFFKGKSEID